MNFFRILAFLLGGRRSRRRRTVSRPVREEALPPLVFKSRIETRATIQVQATSATPASAPQVLKGRCWVIDGDTIVIDNVRLRLAGIDAPELDHPWGQRSKWALVQLCRDQVITAKIAPEQSYDRLVAECFLPDGRDLAAELVSSGLALDWAHFSGGKYRHLEPADARKKLWKAAARQRGTLKQ